MNSPSTPSVAAISSIRLRARAVSTCRIRQISASARRV
jgi:hypothetical protein